MPPFSKAPLLLLAALALAGCSDAPIQQGVVHLDPRMADGRSSAEVLAALEAPAPTPPLADWTRTARTWRTPEGFTLDATEVGGLTFTVDLPRPTRALITWRRAVDAPGTWPAAAAAEVAVEPGTPVHLQLAGHPAWNGTVEALRITPDRELDLDAQLTWVEFQTRGFWTGAEPLGQGEGAAPSDGGLVALNDAARRVWPAAFGVPLVDTVRVPRDGRLLFDVALTERHRDALERVHLAVDVAEVGTDPLQGKGWTRVWSRHIVPRHAPAETLWRWTRVDLAEFAGETLDVRFRAWSGHGLDTVAAGLDGDLSSARADVLWGAPETLGDPGDWPLPNLLLVTLDTTRADFGGAPTPYLDELAARGLVFTDAVATSNSTQPSHASILTGTYPIDHGVHDNYAQLLGANRTLPERLRELGYHTVGAVSQRFLGAGYGFGQGFDAFYQAGPGASLDGGVTIERLQQRIAEWGRVEPDRPVFLWLHLFDPHTPYTAPDDYARSHAERFGPGPQPGDPGNLAFPATTPTGEPFVEALPWLDGRTTVGEARHLYAVEVSYADSLVENLASSFAAAELLGKTAIFVTADHGESLGEHGVWFDHKGVHAANSEVPFLVAIPGGPTGEVDEPVSGIDLAPTLLRYAAAGRPVDMGGMRGRDLLAGTVTAPLDQGGPLAKRPRLIEHAERIGYALRLGDEQLIRMERDIERIGFGEVHSVSLYLPAIELEGESYFDLGQASQDPGTGRSERLDTSRGPYGGEPPLRRTDLAGALLPSDSGASLPSADDPAVAARMDALRRMLDALLADAWDVPAGASSARETTPAERADLDALGY